MTSTELTPYQIVEAGVAVTPTTPTADPDTYYFNNDGKCFIYVKNAGASPDNVTITGQLACSFGVIHDRVVAVAAATEKYMGPFPASHFNDTSGHCHFKHSFVTSVTHAVLKMNV